jgi:chromosome segregation and condensation protein ScpB
MPKDIEISAHMLIDDDSHIPFFEQVEEEMEKIKKKGYVLHTYHEGYGLMQEEVAEFFDEVRKKASNRDLENVKLEVAQIAAICLRIYLKAIEDEHSRN